MSDTLTAAEALEEVLARAFSAFKRPWRKRLLDADATGLPDAMMVTESFCYGDLRRWSAPLLREERPESVSQEELVRRPVVAMEALLPWERLEAIGLMEEKFCLNCGEDMPTEGKRICTCTRDD